MERTKETLEARVRETPLVDRLKECQQRIGNMCAELRGPKMSIPVEYYDDDFYICTTLADAQAQIEALQRERDEAASDRDDWLTSWRVLQRHNERIEAALDAEREKVKDFEAAAGAMSCKEIADKVAGYTQLQDWRDQVTLALQRAGGARFEDVPGHVKTVVDDLTQLQALVRALPVVKGKFEVGSGVCYYVRALDGKENPVVCGLMTEQATAFAIKALLAYRATLDATTPDSNQLGDINDMVSKGGNGE